MNIKKALLLELGGGLGDWVSLISALQPLVWLRFRETSGVAVPNYGTGGATFDGVWTPGSGAQGQTDSLGANEAYDFQGGSLVTVPISGLLATSPQVTMVYLIKPATAGPGGIGGFHFFGGSNFQMNWNGALTGISASVDINGTDPASISSNGFTAAQNAILAHTWDFNGDRLIRLYRGVNGVASELSYSSQVPGGGGTFLNRSGNLVIGNNAGNGRINNGLFGEFMFWPSVISQEVLNAITAMSKAG